MLNEAGGVIDDLIVYLASDGYRVVVNAATREKDLAWMNTQAESFAVKLTERADLAMIAVQGPQALELVKSVFWEQYRAERTKRVSGNPVFSGWQFSIVGL